MVASIGLLGAIGIGASAVGFGANLVGAWARNKETKQALDDKVDKAVEKKLKEYGITIVDEDEEEEEGEEADEG